MLISEKKIKILVSNDRKESNIIKEVKKLLPIRENVKFILNFTAKPITVSD